MIANFRENIKSHTDSQKTKLMGCCRSAFIMKKDKIIIPEPTRDKQAKEPCTR